MGTCCEAQQNLRPSASLVITKPTTQSQSQKIKIEYFENRYGRVDPVVMLLAHQKVEYEWVGIERASWFARKAAGNGGEMQVLPILTLDDVPLQQTNAILRSFGIMYGYYDPKDWISAGI